MGLTPKIQSDDYRVRTFSSTPTLLNNQWVIEEIKWEIKAILNNITPVRMAKRRQKVTNIGKMWKNKTFLQCWWEGNLRQLQYGKQYGGVIKLPYDPENPLILNAIEIKTGWWRCICNLMFTETLFTIAQIWKAT